MTSQSSSIALFGGDQQWSERDWTSSDDRVRGGASQSYLTFSSTTAHFHGTLDIKTLGGAGFASQRTTGEDRVWDLSSYSGLCLDISSGDDKQYTFILKDELLPKSPDGREQSTISWEYDFKVEKDGQKVFMPWADLKPTYRGKERTDVKPLDLKNVKRISIMMRSFFGTQEGPFSLTLRSISATKKQSISKSNLDTDDESVGTHSGKSLQSREVSDTRQRGLMGKLLDACCVS